MTAGDSKDDVDWRFVVRGVKARGSKQARALVEATILHAGGLPLRIREARRQLLGLTSAASEGRPSIIEGENGLVCVIAVDDLVDIVVERGPTLKQVMDAAGTGRGNRGKGDAEA